MQTITIPIEEYRNLKMMAEIINDHELLSKFNSLIDLMYENKYGIYTKDFVEDLTEQSINSNWNDEPSPWDNI
jgi:hypothetical protein